MSNDIIATVPNFTLIQAGAIYRGKSGKDLKVEFKDDQKPAVIKEKLVEVKPPVKEPPVKPKDKVK